MNRQKFLVVLILIAIGSSVYFFNLKNQLFWDDDEWIKANVFAHSFSYLKEIFTLNILAGFGLNSNYYRPLLVLTFAFNYIIHGFKPLGYHLLSNGFHLANGFLIFLLLSRFINSRASFLAALLFLIHPLQTEAVTYISGRGDPLSVFFMLLSLWFFVKVQTGHSLRYWILSLISFVLAVLSRETAFLFPIFLAVFYISFLAKEKFYPALKKSVIAALPYFAISAFYMILRLTVFNFKNTLNFYSQANDYTNHLSYRLFTFGHVLLEYFKLIFMPVGLHMERDLPLKTSLFQWPVWLSILIVLLIVYIGFIFYKKEKISDRENLNFKIWFFGWGWFFAALAPVSGVIPINAVMYEHWLYLPLIGFFTLAGFYLDKLLIFLKSRKLTTYSLLLTALSFYFLFFAVQSARRNILWGQPIKFYEDIIKYNPNSARVLTNLGNLYSENTENKNLKKAAEYYKRAIESPNGSTFAQPYYNLGNIYRDSGQIDQAIEYYRKAIVIDPNFPFAYQNLAVIYINNKKDLVKGGQVLEDLKKIQPGNPRVYYNLGLIYLAQNNIGLAIKNLETALNLAQKDIEVKSQIEALLARIKKINK